MHYPFFWKSTWNLMKANSSSSYTGNLFLNRSYRKISFIIYPACIDPSDKHNNLQKIYVQTLPRCPQEIPLGGNEVSNVFYHTRMGVFMKNMRKCTKEISHDLGCRSAVWQKYQFTRSADPGKALIVELQFLEHQNSDRKNFWGKFFIFLVKMLCGEIFFYKKNGGTFP
jgi:hypothetical protein